MAQQQQPSSGLRDIPSSSPWTKADRKVRAQLERALRADEGDHVTRFALVRLLAKKGDCVAAEELIGEPGAEEKLLADPTTHVAMLSSLGGAYLMLWRARWETSSSPDGAGGWGGEKNARGFECRLDVSSERADLLHRAQHFFEEALMAPENMNNPAIRAQVAFCKEARGDCAEALSLYASIISDSSLSPGTSAIIFRTSVLLAHVGRLDECVRYLEYIEGEPSKGCSPLLVEAFLYTCYVAMGLEMKASRRLLTLREAFNDEYTAGRIGAGYSRDEIPWDRLAGWFYMWKELGVQSLRAGDYYAGVHMLSQAILQREEADTLVFTAEMLWVLGDAKRALQLCERAYAADPLHVGAKRRLSGWTPTKWKDRIAKEEDRRGAVVEMQRVAELSEKKAAAMVARRARREKARALRGWRRFHAKRNNRRAAREGGASAEAAATSSNTRRGIDAGASGPSTGGSEASDRSSSSATTSGGSSSRSSRGSSGSPSSSSSLPSSLSSQQTSVDESVAARRPSQEKEEELSYSASHPRRRHGFPVPSASEAVEAGRANYRACLRAQTERVNSGLRPPEEGARGPELMAPVDVAAKVARETMVGGRGVQRFYTPELRALARFEWQRRAHEAKNTRVLYGS